MKKVTLTASILALTAAIQAQANGDSFHSICEADAKSVGLEGAELRDYMDACLANYSYDEPGYDEEPEPEEQAAYDELNDTYSQDSY